MHAALHSVYLSRLPHAFGFLGRLLRFFLIFAAAFGADCGGELPFEIVTISGHVRDAQGTGLRGVVVEVDALGTTAITDSAGRYEIQVPRPWTGVVAPRHPTYTFEPASRSFNAIAADQADQDFVVTGELTGGATYTISGRVTLADGAPVGSVSVEAQGFSSGGVDASDTTDATGFYALILQVGWSGSVVPSLSGQKAIPASRVYTGLGADRLDQDFVFEDLSGGSLQSGDNRAPSAQALSSIAVEDVPRLLTLIGTDQDGDNLTFEIVSQPAHGTLSGLNNGGVSSASVLYTPEPNYFGNDSFTYRATDGNGGVTAPATFSITVDAVNDPPTFTAPGAQFVATNDTLVVNLAPVSPGPSNESSQLVTWSVTSSNQTVLANGNLDVISDTLTITAGSTVGTATVTLTASDNGGVANSGQNQMDVQFLVSVGDVAISGQVLDYSGTGYAGVQLVATGTGAFAGVNRTATTDGSGNYALLVPPGWTGTVATDENYRIEPASRDYTNVVAVQLTQGFTAYRNFYVAVGGNDAGNGTFDDEFASPQVAANMTNPGDTVFIKAGTYLASNSSEWTAVLDVPVSGTASQPIRFQNHDNDIVIFDGEAVLAPSGSNGHRTCVIVDPGIAHIEISGLVVKFAFRNGILVQGSDILIENCIAEHCGLNQNNAFSAGINFEGASSFVCRNAVSRNCYAGFAAQQSDNGLFERCIAANCGFYADGTAIHPENADGFTTSVARNGSDNVRIVRCVAYGNGDDQFDLSHSRDCSVEACYAFYGNDQNHPDGDGGGFKVGNDQNETPGSGSECRRLLVRNCIAFANNGVGIDPRDGIDAVFYNNTAYGNLGQFGFSSGAPGHAVLLMNNLSWGNSTSDLFAGNTSATANYNNWANSSGSMVTGQDADSIRQDPGFADPAALIDSSWQGGFSVDDVRGIDATLVSIRNQIQTNFALTETAPSLSSIDRGTFVTHTSGGGSAVTVITVTDDPRTRFRVGDTIMIENSSTAVIQSVTSGSLIVDSPLSFDGGAGVHFVWSGQAPDIGAVETP